MSAKAVPVNIPVKPMVPRPPMRNSIEGLNQEIERLVLKAGGAQDTEREEEKVTVQIAFVFTNVVINNRANRLMA